MSNLSAALSRYYSREKKRIIFRDGRALHELAMAMWEELGFQQVDASVISRVLNGERLFTASQLKVFCTVLTLPKREEEYLFLCLEHDRNLELSKYTDMTCIPSSFALEIMNDIIRDSFDMFYGARYDALQERFELIQRFADMYVVKNDHKTMNEILGPSLYLKGRTILCASWAHQAIKGIYPTFRRLLTMSYESNSSLLYGYAYALLGDAYYGAGGYSDALEKRKFYRSSIRFAQKAISSLPDDDREGLYAMRSMVASAHYAHDEQTVVATMKRAKAIIPVQPPNNYVSVLHLSLTIDKALAALRRHNSLLTQDFTAGYFRQPDLKYAGLHEISGIREEVNTLLLLKIKDKDYIKDRLETAIELATHYGASRQKRYLNKMLREL